MVYELVDEENQFDLKNIIENFLERKKLADKIDVQQIMEKIIINKDFLDKEYGINIKETPQESEAKITSFPLF